MGDLVGERPRRSGLVRVLERDDDGELPAIVSTLVVVVVAAAVW